MTTSLCAAFSWFAALEQLFVGQQCVVYQTAAIVTQELSVRSWKDLVLRGKFAFPSWGSASDLVASAFIYHYSDICVQQHTLGNKFSSYLYTLYRFQAIFSLVHRKDTIVIIGITLVFLSYWKILGNLQQCSLHHRP